MTRTVSPTPLPGPPARGRRGPSVLLAPILALACALAVSGPGAAQDDDGLRVYISADMEGVAGVVTGDQLGPSGFEYARFRSFMTDEVVAAIEAAREAGAVEILVSDSHGNGENLLLERIPPDVQVVRSWPRPLAMMEGIDERFDAVLLLGYHNSTANVRGVRAHTMSSANLTGLKLDGREHAEAGVSAAIAGHFGVPVVMISGDDAIVEEARAMLGDIEGAVVKWSLGFHSARVLTPEAALPVIRERVRAALARVDDFEPYRLDGPVTLELSFKNYMPAEILSYLRGVDRADSHTVRFTGADMTEISRFIQVATGYAADRAP